MLRAPGCLVAHKARTSHLYQRAVRTCVTALPSATTISLTDRTADDSQLQVGLIQLYTETAAIPQETQFSATLHGFCSGATTPCNENWRSVEELSPTVGWQNYQSLSDYYSHDQRRFRPKFTAIPSCMYDLAGWQEEHPVGNSEENPSYLAWVISFNSWGSEPRCLFILSALLPQGDFTHHPTRNRETKLSSCSEEAKYSSHSK